MAATTGRSPNACISCSLPMIVTPTVCGPDVKRGPGRRIGWGHRRRRRTNVDLGLTGKRVVVTGASRGIGLAIVRGFVAEGATVVAGARRVTPELEDLDGVTAVAVDLADPAGPAQLVAAAGGRIDVLVNNVGIAPPRPQGFLEVTDDMWATTWNLNVMSAVRATRAALPVMLAGGGGAIVNTGSVNARLADPLVVDYSAAKAALTNFAKSLS